MVDISVLEGWLYKEKGTKSFQILGRRNKRWFSVKNINNDELALCYYRTKSANQPRGWIYIKDVIELHDNGVSSGFMILAPSRVLKLSALTRAEHRLWVEGLRNICTESIYVESNNEKKNQEESKNENNNQNNNIIIEEAKIVDDMINKIEENNDNNKYDDDSDNDNDDIDNYKDNDNDNDDLYPPIKIKEKKISDDDDLKHTSARNRGITRSTSPLTLNQDFDLDERMGEGRMFNRKFSKEKIEYNASKNISTTSRLHDSIREGYNDNGLPNKSKKIIKNNKDKKTIRKARDLFDSNQSDRITEEEKINFIGENHMWDSDSDSDIDIEAERKLLREKIKSREGMRDDKNIEIKIKKKNNIGGNSFLIPDVKIGKNRINNNNNNDIKMNDEKKRGSNNNNINHNEILEDWDSSDSDDIINHSEEKITNYKNKNKNRENNNDIVKTNEKKNIKRREINYDDWDLDSPKKSDNDNTHIESFKQMYPGGIKPDDDWLDDDWDS